MTINYFQSHSVDQITWFKMPQEISEILENPSHLQMWSMINWYSLYWQPDKTQDKSILINSPVQISAICKDDKFIWCHNGNGRGTDSPDAVVRISEENLVNVIAAYDTIIWIRSWRCTCLVTWFCYQMIEKLGNKTGPLLWPDPYFYVSSKQFNR